MRRRPIVGVMGSHRETHAERTLPLGRWIAEHGYHLLTGGGPGVMAEVSRAFTETPERVGLAIGVIPTAADGARRVALPGYPNPWVELPIYGHLDVGGPRGDEPSSRNHVNVLTSSVVILLPGAEGTASEARLACRYEVPCVAFLRAREELPGLPTEVPVEAELEDVVRFVTRHAGPAGAS